MRLRRILRTAAFAAALLLPAAAGATTWTAFDTGDNGEQLTTLPGDNAYRVLFSVDVGTLSANDLIIVNAETEMSNEIDNTVPRWTSRLILTNSATSTTGTELSEDNNFGCERIIHHCVTVKPAIRSFTAASSSTFVNLIVKTTGELEVEQDYGRLQILKVTP